MHIISGNKSINLTSVNSDVLDDVDLWQWLYSAPQSTQEKLFAQVAAAYRAARMTAEAVASLPFALVTKGGADYDTSDEWGNKVGFLPKPQDLFERLELSLIFNNAGYGRMAKNILGYPKRLVYIIPTSIRVITDMQTGEVIRFERVVNGSVAETFAPDDPTLIRIWKLDHTTELLPSKNTDGVAMMNAAGILFYADFWIKNFFERGGVKPTVIGIKGNLPLEKQKEMESAWSKFTRFIARKDGVVQNSKIINSDAVSVTPFGEGIDALNKNEVYTQAIANVAMSMGMPLSLLLANSANYATAQTEYSSWFRNSITPRASFLAEELNDQLFDALGYRLEFRPENTDPEQEDEVARAQSLNTFMDAMNKATDKDILLGVCDTFGYELSESLVGALDKYYREKEKAAAAMQAQLNKQPTTDNPKDSAEQPPQLQKPQQMPQNPPAKWTPSFDEYEELRVWKDVSLRRQKRGEGLDFEFKPVKVELPEAVRERIKARLHFATDQESVKAAFVVDVEPEDDIRKLAEAINNLANTKHE